VLVAEMSEMRPAEVRVAEGDKPRHYSANPRAASWGLAGIGDGPATDFR
jgi:hypothetical protein